MSEPFLPIDHNDERSPEPARHINMRQLQVFRTIMVSGSISGAGRVLHVSQPAISRVLALTEARLGYLLFERVGNRLQPTHEAQRLYAEVESVYQGLDRVNALALHLSRNGADTLHLVASATFGQQLVPRALARLKQQHPDAQLDYRSATYDEMADYFLSGKMDIGLSLNPFEHPGLISSRVGQQSLMCLLPKTHPLANERIIEPLALLETAWIGYPPDTPLGRDYLQFFGINAKPALIEVHSPVNASALARQGLGAAIVDTWCITADALQDCVVRPLSIKIQSDIWVTTSRQHSPPMLAQRFQSALRYILRQGPMLDTVLTDSVG